MNYNQSLISRCFGKLFSRTIPEINELFQRKVPDIKKLTVPYLNILDKKSVSVFKTWCLISNFIITDQKTEHFLTMAYFHLNTDDDVNGSQHNTTRCATKFLILWADKLIKASF